MEIPGNIELKRVETQITDALQAIEPLVLMKAEIMN
jgi:hypothetical protein